MAVAKTWAERHLGLTTLTAFVVAVALTLAIGATTLAVIAISDVSAQSQKSCVVQARGLEANKQILPVWEGINFLLQPHKGIPQAPIAALFRPSVQAIRTHLPKYLALQHMQPAGRKC